LCKRPDYQSGIPLEPNSTVSFILTFSANRLYGYSNITSAPKLNFTIEAKTLSEDDHLENNIVHLIAKLKIRANLLVYGTKTPEQLFYGNNEKVEDKVIRGESDMKSLEDIGPIIEHTYTIINTGPFSVDYFQLAVDWPHETKLNDFNPSSSLSDSNYTNINGKHLLYLTEKPTKIPNNHPINVVCSDHTYEVNSLNLKHSRNKRDINDNGDDDDDEVSWRKLPSTNNQKLLPSPEIAIIDCFSQTALCHRITCHFYGDFNKYESISLKFTARLWNSTLVEVIFTQFL
jgi:hypothetical protein